MRDGRKKRENKTMRMRKEEEAKKEKEGEFIPPHQPA